MFMKISDLRENSSFDIPPTNYGYWISSDGDVYPVEYQSHSETIVKIFDQSVPEVDRYYQAFVQGWIAIGVDISNYSSNPSMDIKMISGTRKSLNILRSIISNGFYLDGEKYIPFEIKLEYNINDNNVGTFVQGDAKIIISVLNKLKYK